LCKTSGNIDFHVDQMRIETGRVQRSEPLRAWVTPMHGALLVD
jgi:hypothetical protein